jgi:hypothetical protein
MSLARPPRPGEDAMIIVVAEERYQRELPLLCADI